VASACGMPLRAAKRAAGTALTSDRRVSMCGWFSEGFRSPEA
jgi:hypothetical protein